MNQGDKAAATEVVLRKIVKTPPANGRARGSAPGVEVAVAPGLGPRVARERRIIAKKLADLRTDGEALQARVSRLLARVS